MAHREYHINGHTYHVAGLHKTKEGATKAAKWMRDNGYKAQVRKSGNSWASLMCNKK